ncbi:MAG: bifunctional 2-C-methyl-D-erythritol 4-phosphate cytidylyltransferase/2-C-methyl-D-erythritol 2,4-cyclodiphosphate synthase [Alphaproteobacteria bacterium]|nr:bifunctional 2-C-methyl-D-erythritol 4-phosphate cytidylyltransferase/2-C-methyl-D-erythritol 2,4-cyclodiphosphate synthase [Alphaproteobacteria bacterium]
MQREAAIDAVIVAGGQGARAGGSAPKQFQPILGRSLLSRAVAGLRGGAPALRRLVVVLPPGEAAAAALDVGPEGPVLTATGGETRQASVLAGLESLAGDAPGYVLIHDAARPFASPAMIARVIAALDADHGAIPTLAVSDTLKRATADGLVGETVAREGLHRVQTPQGFPFAAILAAHRALAGESLTDDAALAERAGLPVRLVAGEEDNFKITAPGDFARAERFLLSRTGDVRAGLGYDVHRFGPGDHVMLCGLAVPHSAGLVGHSDADVGLHALTDALLGALGEGDIGLHFPPGDPKTKGAASDAFLAHARDRVLARGGIIAHVDVTIICERPKVSPHRDAMRAIIGDILRLPVARVSVKATTTEGLGFTGRGEGIAAQAVATVRLPA